MDPPARVPPLQVELIDESIPEQGGRRPRTYAPLQRQFLDRTNANTKAYRWPLPRIMLPYLAGAKVLLRSTSFEASGDFRWKREVENGGRF